MIDHADSFSPKQITFLGTRHIHNAIADAECEMSPMVHQSSYCQVSQRKQGPSLTNMSAIQMLCRHRHLSYSMVFIHLSNPAAGIGSKAIGTIQ